MKLETARTLFLAGALIVTTAAAAAWAEPRTTVFSKSELLGQCATPRTLKPLEAKTQPDHDLLLFLFGMRQGLRPFG